MPESLARSDGYYHDNITGMRTLLTAVLALSLCGLARAEEEAAPDALPRVKLTLRSAGEPLDVGVEREVGGARGTRFDVVCQTPCAVSVPTHSAALTRLQVRAPGSPGAALDLDAASLDGAHLTLQPPGRTRIRAGAALVVIGAITTLVGGVLMPYGREVATRADVNPDAGLPGGAVTFGAGVASTVAGALLLATARPKVRQVDKKPEKQTDKRAPEAGSASTASAATLVQLPL
jgi:hypothetical protein